MQRSDRGQIGQIEHVLLEKLRDQFGQSVSPNKSPLSEKRYYRTFRTVVVNSKANQSRPSTVNV